MNKALRYKKIITKEEISALELDKYSGEVVLVETQKALEKACKEILECTVIGIDTETKPSFKKGQINSVALLQIATDKKAYIIRLKLVVLCVLQFSLHILGEHTLGFITPNTKENNSFCKHRDLCLCHQT